MTQGLTTIGLLIRFPAPLARIYRFSAAGAVCIFVNRFIIMPKRLTICRPALGTRLRIDASSIIPNMLMKCAREIRNNQDNGNKGNACDSKYRSPFLLVFLPMSFLASIFTLVRIFARDINHRLIFRRHAMPPIPLATTKQAACMHLALLASQRPASAPRKNCIIFFSKSVARQIKRRPR